MADQSLTRKIGPHIGLENAWPMSLLLQVMTTDDDAEIGELLKLVLKSCKLGLVHESINVNRIGEYTRKFSTLPPFQEIF